MQPPEYGRKFRNRVCSTMLQRHCWNLRHSMPKVSRKHGKKAISLSPCSALVFYLSDLSESVSQPGWARTGVFTYGTTEVELWYGAGTILSRFGRMGTSSVFIPIPSISVQAFLLRSFGYLHSYSTAGDNTGGVASWLVIFNIVSFPGCRGTQDAEALSSFTCHLPPVPRGVASIRAQ